MNIIEFPLHIGDFLGGTMAMSTEEVGAYMLLIVAHFQSGVEGLPNDNNMLARITRLSPKKWLKMRPVMESKFEISESFWTHKKVKMVIQKIQEKSDVQRAKVLKRWDTPHTAVIPKGLSGNTTVIPTKNHKPIKEKIDKKESSPMWFEGKVIRLNRMDYERWLKIPDWPEQAFERWLNNRDEWFDQNPDKATNWFISTENALKKLHREKAHGSN